MTLDRYMEKGYLPVCDERCRPSTAKGYRGLWQLYVKGRAEAQRKLWEYRASHIQDLLNAVAADNELRKTTSPRSSISSAEPFTQQP
jgi:hypothetical protein